MIRPFQGNSVLVRVKDGSLWFAGYYNTTGRGRVDLFVNGFADAMMYPGPELARAALEQLPDPDGVAIIPSEIALHHHFWVMKYRV